MINKLEKRRLLLLNVQSILKIISNNNSFVIFLKSVTYSIDKIDNDKEVMNASEMMNLENRGVVNYQNKSVEKFHQDVLGMIDNRFSTKFLIFKN